MLYFPGKGEGEKTEEKQSLRLNTNVCDACARCSERSKEGKPRFRRDFLFPFVCVFLLLFFFLTQLGLVLFLSSFPPPCLHPNAICFCSYTRALPRPSYLLASLTQTASFMCVSCCLLVELIVSFHFLFWFYPFSFFLCSFLPFLLIYYAFVVLSTVAICSSFTFSAHFLCHFLFCIL